MSKLDKKKSNILLVDSSLDISDYEQFSGSSEIISLDYESHHKLSEKKIIHKISDEFISINELKKLDDLIYEFVNWYSVDKISTILLDDGINLGELFYFEFRFELTRFLKKYLEISKIHLKYEQSFFLSSKTSHEIISIFSENSTIIKSNKKNESIFSTVDVPFNLGKKQFTIKLSSRNISKLKNILNKSVQVFLNKNIKNDFKTLLLIGFTTLKNEEFLLKSKNYDLNIIKYDVNLPSIWNKKTFGIIKNSNCIVENESTLLNKKFRQSIEDKKIIFLEKLDTLLTHENLLSKHFSINGSTFWNAMKPLFVRLCEKYFLQAAEEIILGNRLFEKYNLTSVLIFNESEMTEQIITLLAKKHNISIFQIQHGLYYDSPEMVNENKFDRLISYKSDFFITWGEIYKKYLIKNSVKQNQIKSLGSFFFDKISLNNIKYTPTHVLLASDPLAFNRLIDLSFQEKELYRKTIDQICKIFSSIEKQLVIKTHPQKNQFEKEIVKKIDSSIQVFNSGNIHPLIQSSELVVTTDMSTVILEAMILKKPVVSIRMKDHYGLPEIFNYCPQISLNSFESWVQTFYSNPEIKNTMMRKQNEFLKIYLNNPGNASSELLKFLDES
jgi:hypothetical protein